MNNYKEMEYYLSLDDLDRPIHKVDENTLFKCQPFFNDYYIVLYLKIVHVPKLTFKPTIVNDRDLVISYGATQLGYLVSQIIAAGEQIHSTTFKIAYKILVLRNGWWSVYIEKRYIWDFQSLGVITILSPSRTAVLEFFQKHFIAKLIKQPRFKKNKLKTLSLSIPQHKDEQITGYR
uniref:Uncharacterized protein n=1 Tax=Marseillevirus LCMAC201 TaxID=2506605 RepID=A0A481YX58_9VIRU|nr:MAG: hypothetical protein LCMAC201_00080 [Marseillevirus LCMAC201]